jgi:hypothetical protein
MWNITSNANSSETGKRPQLLRYYHTMRNALRGRVS